MGLRIINKMRRQSAIYWPPLLPDDFGRLVAGPLVELVQVLGGPNLRVRWEDISEDFVDAQGTTRSSRAVVYVPELSEGVELEVGGWLWLGYRADLLDEIDPRGNVRAYEIRRFDKLPTLRATQTLRTVYL